MLFLLILLLFLLPETVLLKVFTIFVYLASLMLMFLANKVLGMHRLKNKVTINAFDLSHRHMFTTQVGELLPVFTQWCNPNETFKIGYNGKTRTASLNSDAFTRIRESIQYYFVPFQSLWKYFEQQVNNMTKGDAGQNISKFASSSTDASQTSTSLPYISYVDLGTWLSYMVDHACVFISQYFFILPLCPIPFDGVVPIHSQVVNIAAVYKPPINGYDCLT